MVKARSGRLSKLEQSDLTANWVMISPKIVFGPTINEVPLSITTDEESVFDDFPATLIPLPWRTHQLSLMTLWY